MVINHNIRAKACRSLLFVFLLTSLSAAAQTPVEGEATQSSFSTVTYTLPSPSTESSSLNEDFNTLSRKSFVSKTCVPCEFSSPFPRIILSILLVVGLGTGLRLLYRLGRKD